MRTKTERNAWSRERTCRVCHRVDNIRRDNPADLCRSCAGRESGALGLITIIARKKPKLPPLRKPRVERRCKTCATSFMVAPSVLSGKTNSSANFCSRPCYYAWLRLPRETRP